MKKVNPRTKPPAFQFYPRNMLTSTAFNAMTTEERGGYFGLFCHAWLQARPGWLPDDDRVLAALSGLGRRWEVCRAGISRAYRVRRGWWVDVWMVLERRDQRRKSLKRAVAGQAGGWQKASNSLAKASTASASASATALKRIEPHPTPPAAARRSVPVQLTTLPEWLPREAWDDWCAFRKAKGGKAWTPRAQSLSIGVLEKLRADGQDAVQVIEQSILRGWTGLFPLKDVLPAPETNGAPVRVDDWPPPSRANGRRPPGYVRAPLSDEWIPADQRPAWEKAARSSGRSDFNDP